MVGRVMRSNLNRLQQTCTVLTHAQRQQHKQNQAMPAVLNAVTARTCTMQTSITLHSN